jgi:hypothetical protein
LVLVACVALQNTSGADLTAVTLFGCDETGTVDVAMRHNTGPVDAAWDLFLYEGDVFDPATGSAEQVRWLNNADDHTVRMPLAPGTHTLTFHFEMSRPWPVIGMNLFFDGKNDRAGISVKAPMQTAIGAVPEFTVNASQRTMGWPITDIPASGALACGGPDRGIWDFSDAQSACRITLKSFRCSIPEIDRNLDLVGAHGIGPNGTPDAVGQLVLEVEPCAARPSDLFVWLQTVAGVTAGAPDMTDLWKTQLDGETVLPPFSFTCGEQSAHDLLKRASCRVEHATLDADRLAHRVTYSAPNSGLEVRWEGVEYPRFQTVEWTVYLKNVGHEDTPLLKDILALDTRFTRRGDEGEFNLHHNRGDTCAPDAFEPLATTLGPEESLRMAPQGGRPTNGAFPYFNLRAGDEGVVIAIGWPGQWAAEFARDKQVGLRIEAGQELTCLTLHPGEEIRTPLIVLQFTTQADWVAAQNTWRQWMIAHNVPRPGGRPLPLPMFNACSSHQFAEMTRASEENQKQFIDHYLAKGLNIDYWWMDAGWYVGAEEKGWPWTGTWEVDRRPHRFPNGLRAVSDHAHAKNVRTIVWFEPERVAAGTWLATERPDWVLGGSGGGLLNLGNPETWQWLTNHIDKLIREEGIDLYRQDFNIDPLSYWRGNDAEDRQGITENKYVVGTTQRSGNDPPRGSPSPQRLSVRTGRATGPHVRTRLLAAIFRHGLLPLEFGGLGLGDGRHLV